MPASRKRSSARKSSSSKRSSVKRHVAKSSGPLRHLNHFMSDLGQMEAGIVPTGTGGYNVGLVPKGRKKESFTDILMGHGPTRKMNAVERYKAIEAAYGPENAIDPTTQVLKCLPDEYRTGRDGKCIPKPAMGSDQYNAMNKTDYWVRQNGPFGGMENVVRLTRPDGSQVTRIAEATRAGGLLNMFLNPGSEKSDKFYDQNGQEQYFRPDLRYSTTYSDPNGAGPGRQKDLPLPPGWTVGPNRVGQNGSIFREDDYGAMRRANLKPGWIGDGKDARKVAVPREYGNGRSYIPGQAPFSLPNIDLNSAFGIGRFPPKAIPYADQATAEQQANSLKYLNGMYYGSNGSNRSKLTPGESFRSIGSRWW